MVQTVSRLARSFEGEARADGNIRVARQLGAVPGPPGPYRSIYILYVVLVLEFSNGNTQYQYSQYFDYLV